ncbi:MAG: hypothetical protein SVP26_10595 [Chloroflexota bacterium]|nr:hypothetical protein [Chloroflexota bacterium]
MTQELVACWHHADEKRLRKNLECGRIDLYGRHDRTENRTKRLDHWWNKMRLKKGDRIRIVVAGHIRAFARIAGEPYDLPANEVCGKWGSAVDLIHIDVQAAPFPIASCAHLQGSHRFDGPKTSLLAR